MLYDISTCIHKAHVRQKNYDMNDQNIYPGLHLCTEFIKVDEYVLYNTTVVKVTVKLEPIMFVHGSIYYSGFVLV